MRVNISADEFPDERKVEIVSARVGDRVYWGARIFGLLSDARELPDAPGDDDPSAVTFWGTRGEVAALLRKAADAMERSK